MFSLSFANSSLERLNTQLSKIENKTFLKDKRKEYTFDQNVKFFSRHRSLDRARKRNQALQIQRFPRWSTISLSLSVTSLDLIRRIKCDQQSIRIDSARVIIVRPNRACRDIFRLKNQFNNTKQSHTRFVYEILIETIKNLHMISFQLCVSKYSRWISEFLYRDYLQEYSLICMLHWIEYSE